MLCSLGVSFQKCMWLLHDLGFYPGYFTQTLLLIVNMQHGFSWVLINKKYCNKKSSWPKKPCCILTGQVKPQVVLWLGYISSWNTELSWDRGGLSSCGKPSVRYRVLALDCEEIIQTSPETTGSPQMISCPGDLDLSTAAPQTLSVTLA